MTASDRLGMDLRTIAPLQPLRFITGTTTTTLGGVLGATNGGAGTDAQSPSNRVYVLSHDTGYAVGIEGLYKSVNLTLGAAATWALDKSFASVAPGTNQRVDYGGIWSVADSGSGDIYLAGWSLNASSIYVGWRLNLTTDLFEETTSASGSRSGFLGTIGVKFGQVIHIHSHQNFFTWDPISEIWSNMLTTTNNPSQGGCFCIRPDGKLHWAGISDTITGAGEYRGWQFGAGAWNDLGVVYAVPGASVFAQRDHIRCALIAANPAAADIFFLYVVKDSADTTVGFRCRKIVSPYTGAGTDVTPSTVFPAAMRTVTDDGGSATTSANKRIEPDYDQQQSVGLQRCNLRVSDGPRLSTFSLYLWQGESALVAALGSGIGNIGMASPYNNQSGGAGRSYEPSQSKVHIDGFETGVSGGLKITYSCTEPPATGTHKIRLRFGQNSQMPVTLGTMISPITGGGTLISANEISGVPFDGTAQTLTWDYEADGLDADEALAAWTLEGFG